MNAGVQGFLELIVLEGESVLEYRQNALEPTPELKRFIERAVGEAEELLKRHGAPLPKFDARLLN